MLDADAIFIYKTIVSTYKNVYLVTELSQLSTMSFLVQEND